MTATEGFEQLLAALDDSRQGRVAVAIVDVRLALEGAKGRGWPWPKAWSSAINMVQARNIDGVVRDPEEQAEMLEARTLLEEDRAAFRAAYEGRRMTDRENAERLLVARARVGVDAA